MLELHNPFWEGGFLLPPLLLLLLHLLVILMIDYLEARLLVPPVM
jgi:hypothetical protein